MNAILSHLKEHASRIPYTLADLAQATRQTPAAVQAACEELERAGKVRREEDGWVRVHVHETDFVNTNERMLF